MTDRLRTTLGELLDQGRALISGPFGSNISSRFFVEQGIPVIRGNNLTSGMERFVDSGFVFVTKDKADELRADAYADDLIFTAAGTIGQVGLIPSNGRHARYVISNKQIRARLDKTRIDPLFAFYWFSAPQSVAKIQTHNTGSTIPLINLSVVRGLPIELPSLGVQRGIVELLGALDDKIELNRRMNETLEAMARAIFRDWFVDFGPTRAKMEGREPYLAPDLWSLFPDRLDDEGNPEGWETRTVSSMYDVRIGRTPPRGDHHHFLGTGQGQTWLSIRDMAGLQVFAFESSEDLAPSSVSAFRIPVVKKGTAILSFKLTVGRVAIAATDMCTNEAIASLAPRADGYAGPCFTYLFLRNYDYSRIGSTSSIATAFNSNSVREMVVNAHVPTILRAFEELLSPLFNKIEANGAEAHTLAATRDLLLPKLMSGEIRIGDAETIAGEAA